MSDLTSSLTAQLAKHLCRAVPKNVECRAGFHLLDWLGCVAGARQSTVAQVVRSAEPDPVKRAAFLGNLLEMDDVHRASLLHPGPVVWPAALLAARDGAADMSALLRAGVRGYEAAIAIGATLDTHHYRHWHNSATGGIFGSAAAAGSVLALDEAQLVSALGSVGSVAGGLWHMRHAPVMTKQFHIAHAAQSGAWAARLAKSGLTGPPSILEGPQGLYAATTEQPRPLALTDGWRITETSFKPWAACRHSHPAIDTALVLKARGTLKAPIMLETYDDALRFCDRPEPVSTIDAKFSLQHSIAVVAVRGEPWPQDYEPEAIDDPAIRAFRAQVIVRAAEDITARYPLHFGARMTSMDDVVEHRDTRGDPERPVSEDDIVTKVRTLIAWGGLPDGEADRAIALATGPGGTPKDIVALLEDWL